MTSKPALFLSSHRHSKSLFSILDKRPASNSNSTRNSPLKTTKKPVTENNGQPKYIIHKVHHYRQRFNWDCGVSCVLMLLPEDQRRHFLDNFTDICIEEGFGESTWTIDLCYLLTRFNIDHQMHSTAIGVNEDLKKLSYYDNIMEMDRNRIQLRFEEAEARGIRINEGKCTNEMLKYHLTIHGPVIVLVDSGLLVCDLCKHNKIKYEFRKIIGGSYCGHYILVTGYTRDKVLYHDPALSERICATSFSRLSDARTATGTDNDIICIFANRSS